MIRVAHIEDHPIVRDAVARVLAQEEDIVLVASAATVPEALVITTGIDIALLDLRLESGPSVTSNIRMLQSIGAEVVVYTSAESRALLDEAARAGAAGLVRKSEAPRLLVETIRAVQAGEADIPTELAIAIDDDEGIDQVDLTPREREILARYAIGQSADTVSRDLGVSKTTVLGHVKNIRRKYAEGGRAAPTKVHLYVRAIEDEVIDPL